MKLLLSLLTRLATIISLLMVFNLSANTDEFRPNSVWYLNGNLDEETRYILIGTNHTFKAESHPQTKDIEEIFSFFNPDVVMTEGGMWKPRKTKKESLECCSEMGDLL